MATDYEDMTADELDEEIVRLNNEQAERRQMILGLRTIYDRKREEELLARRLDGLSEEQVNALAARAAVNDQV